jgi:hypothetical protein
LAVLDDLGIEGMTIGVEGTIEDRLEGVLSSKSALSPEPRLEQRDSKNRQCSNRQLLNESSIVSHQSAMDADATGGRA